MNKLFIILIVLLLLPTVNASYYNEIREQGKELGTPEEIYWWTWSINQYEFQHHRLSLREYWETDIGDCTEVARVQYIMYKSIGLKSRISHGYKNGGKHDYAEFYNGTWSNFERNTTRVGRGIW